MKKSHPFPGKQIETMPYAGRNLPCRGHRSVNGNRKKIFPKPGTQGRRKKTGYTPVKNGERLFDAQRHCLKV
jgi:hypothetical protein